MTYHRHSPLEALGAVTVPSSPPPLGVPQPPIWPGTTSPHGAFAYIRRSSSDGACGVSGYPCVHPGADLVGKGGTPVKAPEDGTIVRVASGTSPPFTGYGPWVVVLEGKSGWFHLLAHLDPAKAALASPGLPVRAGQVLGSTSSANHVHWEVRRAAVPPSGGSNKTNNIDPFAWLGRYGGRPGTGWMLVAAVAAVLLLARRG